MGRPQKPRALVPPQPPIESVHLGSVPRRRLARLAGLNGNQAEAFFQDIEEVLAGYSVMAVEAQNRLSPASQRMMFSDVRRSAQKLLHALTRLNSNSRFLYNQAGERPVIAPLWERDVSAVSQIIGTLERAERVLTAHVHSGPRKDAAMHQTLILLFLVLQKHAPAAPTMTKTVVADFFSTALTEANISCPDPAACQTWLLSKLFTR